MEKFQLSTTRTFEDVWQDMAPSEEAISSNPYPKKEVFFLRGDHTGYRWYVENFPVHTGLATPELKREFNELMKDILETEPIKNGIPGILEFCKDYPESVLKDGSMNRYNFYYEGEAGNYWIQFLDMPKNYNIYAHAYIK